jgi:hypothetical protein
VRSTATVHDLGTYLLPSGQRIQVTARVTVEFEVPQLPPSQRGVFLEDVMPRAVARLRQEFSRLQYTVGKWREQ